MGGVVYDVALHERDLGTKVGCVGGCYVVSWIFVDDHEAYGYDCRLFGLVESRLGC